MTTGAPFNGPHFTQAEAQVHPTAPTVPSSVLPRLPRISPAATAHGSPLWPHQCHLNLPGSPTRSAASHPAELFIWHPCPVPAALPTAQIRFRQARPALPLLLGVFPRTKDVTSGQGLCVEFLHAAHVVLFEVVQGSDHAEGRRQRRAQGLSLTGHSARIEETRSLSRGLWRNTEPQRGRSWLEVSLQGWEQKVPESSPGSSRESSWSPWRPSAAIMGS